MGGGVRRAADGEVLRHALRAGRSRRSRPRRLRAGAPLPDGSLNPENEVEQGVDVPQILGTSVGVLVGDNIQRRGGDRGDPVKGAHPAPLPGFGKAYPFGFGQHIDLNVLVEDGVQACEQVSNRDIGRLDKPGVAHRRQNPSGILRGGVDQKIQVPDRMLQAVERHSRAADGQVARLVTLEGGEAAAEIGATAARGVVRQQEV